MNGNPLVNLATLVGLSVVWTDAYGRPQTVSDQTLIKLLTALGYPSHSDEEMLSSLDHARQDHAAAHRGPLITHIGGQPCPLGARFAGLSLCTIITEGGEQIETQLDQEACLNHPLGYGYHQLFIGDQQITLAVTPPACQSVESLVAEPAPRIWGLSAQLYALRRSGDGGVGDSLALQNLAIEAAHAGADVLAISPVHAMFSDMPDIYSPYSPSNRSFFNILYAAPEQVFGRKAVDQAIEACNLSPQLTRLESEELVDWQGVSVSRQQLLRHLYETLLEEQSLLLTDFRQFCAQGASELHQHACFEALHAHFNLELNVTDWRLWPEGYREPKSPEVAAFMAEHEDEVGFHLFNQWLVARCLQQTQTDCIDAGMRIGLINDLAVGVQPQGSFSWARQNELLPSVTVGAPPDIFNSSGQNWGVTAFSPSGLRSHGYRAFIETLQANLAYAGGLRIDHVMGLQRLWIIPEGSHPSEGAYINYPFEDLMRLMALESWRNNALIIGEDLGTVPEGLRESLAESSVLGMRVLLFEQDHSGQFIPADLWPDNALATTTTHDLPSILGWIQGKDIHWRHHLGQRSDEQAIEDFRLRCSERNALNTALKHAGQSTADLTSAENQLDACIGFLGSCPAPLVLLPLEDAMGSEEQPNFPGPQAQHPNWRRRWPEQASEMFKGADVQRRLQRLNLSRHSGQQMGNSEAKTNPVPIDEGRGH